MAFLILIICSESFKKNRFFDGFRWPFRKQCIFSIQRKKQMNMDSKKISLSIIFEINLNQMRFIWNHICIKSSPVSTYLVNQSIKIKYNQFQEDSCRFSDQHLQEFMSIKNPINSLYAPWIPITNCYEKF